MGTKRRARKAEEETRAQGDEDLRDLATRNREEVVDFAQKAGTTRVARLLGRAHVELGERIAAAEGLGGPGKDSFTAQQARVARAQIRMMTMRLAMGLGEQVVENTDDASEMGVEHTVGYLQAANERFEGMVAPLPIRPAMMLDRVAAGVRASELRRLSSDPSDPRALGILDRYGTAVVGSFEETLQAGLLTRAPWADVRSQITDQSAFLQAKPAFWAERIVRTETMGAYSRATQGATEEASKEIDDLVRILCATFDNRTGWDSYQVHGQIRRPNEPFVSAFGSYAAPPNRPNDREVMVTHRVAWPIPAYLTPRSDAEAAAAWRRAGRKGTMPPRTWPMTTVPLESFGKGGAAKPPQQAQGQVAPQEGG